MKVRYNKRVAVERVYGTLKSYRKLDGLRVRRLARTWLYVALSILVFIGLHCPLRWHSN